MQSKPFYDKTMFFCLPLLAFLCLLAGCSGSDLPPSHSVQLKEEFSLERSAEIDIFDK